MTKRRFSVLITDLDNTLFDWFDIWFHPFSAMLAEIERVSGVERSTLVPQIREIHQRHGTAEYAFLLQEIPALLAQHPKEKVLQIYASAVQTYRDERSKHMRLYPRVRETLQAIRQKGALIAGYTESMAFYTSYRVRHLGLDGLLDFLYSPEDHDVPADMPLETLRVYPAEHYKFEHTLHRYTPKGELKPNRDVLLAIVSDLKADPEQCVYVGDSLMKDVLMANQAGITAVLAKYGSASRRQEYDLLRQVTHWTDEDVEREKLHNRDPNLASPAVVLSDSLGELLNHFEFDKHE